MKIAVYKSFGGGGYALVDIFYADDDDQADSKQRGYSSKCIFSRKDDDDYQFPKTIGSKPGGAPALP